MKEGIAESIYWIRVFPNKTITPPGCWIYEQRKAAPNGYGRVSYRGEVIYLHRLSLQIHKGDPEPEKDFALHTCDNRRCFNPEHLFWGSQEDNIHDRNDKGRANVAYGDRLPHTKLSLAGVELIRESTDSGIQLAQRFGVSQARISRIRKGLSRVRGG